MNRGVYTNEDIQMKKERGTWVVVAWRDRLPELSPEVPGKIDHQLGMDVDVSTL